MNKILNLVAVAGLTLIAGASAHAQIGASQLIGTGDIKVGLFSPSSSDARNSGGSSQLSVGADYTPPGIPGTQRPTFYGDYQGGSKNGGHVNTYGIGIATKYTQSVVGSLTKVTPYAGIGVGVYRVDIKNEVTGNSGTTTTIGGKVFAGINFSKWLLEANYQLLPKEQGINPSGFGVQIGMSF